MKLLTVMHSYPYPPRIGSALVAYHAISEIARTHSVDFVCYGVPEEKGEFERLLNKVDCLPQCKTSPIFVAMRYLFYLIQGIPPAVTAHMSRAMNSRVASLISDGGYDAILVFEFSAIQYCPKSKLKMVVAHIEDPESIKLDRMNLLSVWSLRQKLKLKLLKASTDRYERNILPKLGKVVLLSESDVLDFKNRRGYTNLGCGPYGVDGGSEKNVPGFDQRANGMIVFSGSMYHGPNVDGALFFLENIYPLVLKEYSSAVLWIVGSKPDKRILAASRGFKEHVVVTGTVTNIADYILRARVSICPVRLQIGIQTKILEAMSSGTPVVTLSAGNSGIRGIPGEDLWVEDSPQEFAKRVAGLLRGEQWLPMSEAGRSLVKKRFTWRHSAQVLESYLADVKLQNEVSRVADEDCQDIERGAH